MLKHSTIAVLVDKLTPKSTARGDPYCLWKFSDLRHTTLTVFLFGEAYSQSWKELPGSVFALLTPKPSPPKDASKDDGGDGGNGDDVESTLMSSPSFGLTEADAVEQLYSAVEQLLGMEKKAKTVNAAASKFY